MIASTVIPLSKLYCTLKHWKPLNATPLVFCKTVLCFFFVSLSVSLCVSVSISLSLSFCLSLSLCLFVSLSLYLSVSLSLSFYLFVKLFNKNLA